ncbi:RHS repeat-associated core domain-containing protein [Pseudomonas faucium]|uniref:RHS repeat-associated core domain-containing protein n=1 Tax=Pseudomonas faucium TaxID=2740518 RepID=UPI00283A8CFC|nr:RHS repeat-associated core domain-containing protein [Pseudomonas faucium]
MSNHCFYQNNHLRTQSSEDHAQTISRQSSTALAEQCKLGCATTTAMIAVDSMGSVLGHVATNTRQSFIYSPYGYRPLTGHRSPALAFNGERPDRLSGLYLLGNGHRGFSTSLGRFISPDTESPFLEGGLNAYAYCLGNPVNLKDSSGRAPIRPLEPLTRQWQFAPPITRRQARTMARAARLSARIARQEAFEFQALAERANYAASTTPSSSGQNELMALSRY